MTDPLTLAADLRARVDADPDRRGVTVNRATLRALLDGLPLIRAQVLHEAADEVAARSGDDHTESCAYMLLDQPCDCFWGERRAVLALLRSRAGQTDE